MKCIFLLAVLFGGVVAGFALAADTSEPLDLDGREVIVRIYRWHPEAGATSEKKTVRIEGRTFRLDPNDLDGSTGLAIVGRDQTDQVVRRQIDRGSQSYNLSEGPQFHLPVRADDLEGRQVVIRVYDRWQQDPAAHHKKALQAKAGAIKFAFEDVNDSAVIAIVGTDQDDKLVRRVVGRQVFGWAYKKGLEFALPKKPPKDANDFCWTFVDALGNPLPNGNVQMYLTQGNRRVFIDKGLLDKNAQFKTRFHISDGDARIGMTRFGLIAHLFVFSHPDYGVAETKVSNSRLKWVGRTITLPFVPSGSEAELRSAWGVVVDPNSKPVPDALVGATAIFPPGGERIGHSGHCQVRTDEQGRFRLYMPIDESEERIGMLIPPGSEYTLRVTPPRGLGLLSCRGRVPSGQENIITLERPETHFHTFVFEDENGTITDRKVLRRTRVSIDRGDKPKLMLKYDDWKNGGLFPLGTYHGHADISARTSYRFEPIEVTADSPEQLVFRVPVEDKRYHGQIVNGVTGRPMAGAFVIDIVSSDTGKNLSMLTPERWDKLHALSDSVSWSHKDLVKVFEPACYDFSKIVRTDENGWFELGVPPKRDFGKLVIFEQNYLTVITDIDKCEQDDKNTFKVPLTRLFPAAKIRVQTWAEGTYHPTRPSVWPECIIDKRNNPPWVHDFLPAWEVDSFMDDIRNDFCLNLNEQCSFPVPAGLYVQIQLRARLREAEHWSPVTIAETVKLRQGQTLDLGRVQIHPTIVVFAEVLNSAGQPIEGVPVTAVSRYGKKISNTDEEGIALFYLARDAAGEFVVEYKQRDEPGALDLREAIPYEIARPEDANIVYTLQVSDEIIYHLFKQGKEQ